MKANEKLITRTLEEDYPDKKRKELYENSPLLRYLEYKTRAVNSSSKARASYANLYAIYVLTEDYLNK